MRKIKGNASQFNGQNRLPTPFPAEFRESSRVVPLVWLPSGTEKRCHRPYSLCGGVSRVKSCPRQRGDSGGRWANHLHPSWMNLQPVHDPAPSFVRSRRSRSQRREASAPDTLSPSGSLLAKPQAEIGWPVEDKTPGGGARRQSFRESAPRIVSAQLPFLDIVRSMNADKSTYQYNLKSIAAAKGAVRKIDANTDRVTTWIMNPSSRWHSKKIENVAFRSLFSRWVQRAVRGSARQRRRNPTTRRGVLDELSHGPG